MRKTIAILLSLFVILSLNACGGNTTAEESTASNNQTEPATTVAETTVEPIATENTTVPETEAPVFDASWAGDEYVMPIPQPPFDSFEISGEGDYQILCSDESEIAELSRQDIMEYCSTLKDLGFTVDLLEEEVSEGSSTGYQFEASNSEGVYCYVAFMESRQAVYILIETE